MNRQRYLADELTYTSPAYNEAQARVELIDPLLEALGWDVSNRAGKPLHLRDVIYEDALKVRGENTTAPDYSLNRGGVRALFVEAKQPSKKLRTDKAAAYQLRRYGWSGGLGLSVLTNFAEIAIYDCRVRPNPEDPASRARLLYSSIDDLEADWGRIDGLISKEAVYSGSLERFARSRARGRAPVDETFLSDLRSWRLSLASSMSTLNPRLDERELNLLVTRTIDRIVFLRICEDRGIETAETLREVAASASPTRMLMAAYERAAERYNSGLFHFRHEASSSGQPDALSMDLVFDEQLLRDQLEKLYFPTSPFEFSVISAEILGKVYEQFLGDTIRLAPDGSVDIEQKPAVRKAGGIFYTPGHIVRYCLENTLEQALASEALGARSRPVLRVIDPACGSGSFLIQAYQVLLDWYLEQYALLGFERFLGRVRQVAASTWTLTIAERKRILVDHIFGVDIDSQAVETTKLSLLLKVLEGESSDTISSQLRLFHERALPNLSRNICCGNSLVSDDIFPLMTASSTTTRDLWRTNPFSFEVEFPEIMASGGFDIVVGNPPYVFGEFHDSDTKPYIERNYELASEQYDTYWIFVERALYLLQGEGRLAYVLPDSLLARSEPAALRRLLLENGLSRLYHCGQVFDVGVSAVVVVADVGKDVPRITVETHDDGSVMPAGTRSSERFRDDPEARFLIHASDEEAVVLRRICEGSVPLSSVAEVSRGEEAGKRNLQAGGTPILVGEDVSPHHVRIPSRYVGTVKKRERNYAGPKVLLVKTGSTSVAAVDESDTVTLQSLYNLHLTNERLSEHALCAILNSKPMHWYVGKTFTAYKLLFPQMNQETVLQLPIPEADEASGARLDELGRSLARLMHDVLQTEHDDARTRLLRRISALEAEVDTVVLDAWGLSQDERQHISI